MSRWLFGRSDPIHNPITSLEEQELRRSQKHVDDMMRRAQKISKHAKKSTDSALTLHKAELKLVDGIANSSLCSTDQDRELTTKSRQWLERVQRHERVPIEINSNLNKVIIEPMKKLSSMQSSLSAMARERDKQAQELTRCQAKFEKYNGRAKTGPNIVKLDQSKRALANARVNYDAAHLALKRDLDNLHSSRGSIIQPCTRELIRNQTLHFSESKRYVEDVSVIMNKDKDLYQEETLEQKIQRQLDEIRALEIVVDDD